MRSLATSLPMPDEAPIMIARLAISCYFCNLDGAKIQKIENIIWLFPILLLPLHPIFENYHYLYKVYGKNERRHRGEYREV
jgi:hypothetical protein